MANYVLVHGSAHGAWCWSRVVPLLQDLGHNVVAVDLPGNGHDATPLAEVTLETYANHVAGVLDSLGEPAVLVGHSLGGITISRAAELRPDSVGVLVYLTALLLLNGDSFMPVSSPESAEVRRALETRDSWNIASDLTHVLYREEMAQHRFYNDCTDADIAWAKSMLVPQPVGPLISPLQTTEENYGRVPRFYIECTLDNAVTPDVAQRMYTASPCVEVISMATGHSPFLSAPEELAERLHCLAHYATAGS